MQERIDTIAPRAGRRSTICLLHASATGPTALTGLAGELQSGSWAVSAPALPGYGETPLKPQPNLIEQACAVASSSTRWHTSTRRVLFGHSMGGLIALLTAIGAQQRGEPLDALVLFDPVLVGLLDRDNPAHSRALKWDRAIIAHLASSVKHGDPETGVAAFVEAWNETRWDALPAKVRAELVGAAPRLVQETQATSFLPLDHKLIAELQVPVLLLNGSRSPELIHLTSRAAHDLLPSSELRTIEDAGHMAPVLAPQTIADAMREFLARELARENTSDD